MKTKTTLLVLSLLVGVQLFSQGNVGIGTTTPQSTAQLHIEVGTNKTKGLLVTGSYDATAKVPSLGVGSRLMFYPGKGAFRTGYADGWHWDDEYVGFFSSAMGYSAIAQGRYSTAMGINTQALGEGSTAIGNEAIAAGRFSTAIGVGTVATAPSSTVVGYYNRPSYTAIQQGMWDHVPLFIVGNGDGDGQQSNAFLVRKDGRVAIGDITPAYRLDVQGRMRIRSGGAASTSAGIWLNRNDNSAEIGFIGVEDGNNIGFFGNAGAAWMFHVNPITGNAWLKGALTQNSDARLKRDITPITGALQKLQQIVGYQYHWKDTAMDASLQSGVLAQEVQSVFPELVKEDSKGNLSVNYSGLVPYLLEATKELTKQNEDLKQKSSEQQKKISRLEVKAEQLQKELELLKAQMAELLNRNH